MYTPGNAAGQRVEKSNFHHWPKVHALVCWREADVIEVRAWSTPLWLGKKSVRILWRHWPRDALSDARSPSKSEWISYICQVCCVQQSIPRLSDLQFAFGASIYIFIYIISLHQISMQSFYSPTRHYSTQENLLLTDCHHISASDCIKFVIFNCKTLKHTQNNIDNIYATILLLWMQIFS